MAPWRSIFLIRTVSGLFATVMRSIQAAWSSLATGRKGEFLSIYGHVDYMSISDVRESGAFVHNLRMNVGKVGLEFHIKHSLAYLSVPDQYSQANAGAIFRSFMTQHGEVEVDHRGWGTFTCFANHVQVWVRKENQF